MHSVKVNRKQLLGIVSENKKKHVQEYEESVADYKAGVIKLAKANLKLANSGDLSQIARMRQAPQAPRSYENEYNRAVRMLELSVEDTIELDEQVFNQLVLDEWGWKQQFVAMASSYKSL